MQTRREVIALLGGAAIATAQPKPNFSGHWIIDTNRTTFQVPADLSETIDDHDRVVVVQTNWDRNRPAGLAIAGLLAPLVVLDATGTQSSNNIPPGLVLRSTSHWDGDKLVTNWNLLGLPNGSDHGNWTRYLTDGGRTMVVEIKASVQTKLVFTKT
jgi:hypothetical protein